MLNRLPCQTGLYSILLLFHTENRRCTLVSKRWRLSRSLQSQSKPNTNKSWRDLSVKERCRRVNKMLRKKNQLAAPRLPKHGLVLGLLWLVRCDDLWHSYRRNIFHVPSIRTSVSTYQHANESGSGSFCFVMKLSFNDLLKVEFETSPSSRFKHIGP